MTVITLTKAPRHIRGDLSRWMQEISQGVYIGNLNTKVREELWIRIIENIKNGKVTMTYSYPNELGYKFMTHNTSRYDIDYDGIPLVFIPKLAPRSEINNNHGNSDASKHRQAKKQQKKRLIKNKKSISFVVLDIETTGINYRSDCILEIGAIKQIEGKIEKFHYLIKHDVEVPKNITELTGIDSDLLNENGEDIKVVLTKLIEFIGSLPIVGYSINFDVTFINSSLRDIGLSEIKNTTIDLLEYIKRENPFINNYKLQTVLKEYSIDEIVIHRGLQDAILIHKLTNKVNGFEDLIFEKAHK